MIRRIAMIAVTLGAIEMLHIAEADAAGRKRLFFRRARTTQRVRPSVRPVTGASQKLHLTHSRSAVLDGFFGPYSGGQGHDRSWYVGR